MANLQQRFEAFMKTVRGFESVDELLRGVHLEGKKRADYLLLDRQVIIEQKVLTVDPADRPQRFVDDLMRQGRILLYGTHSVERVFARLPDGHELKRQMIRGITKGVEDNFTSADKQTRDTREIFSIPDAIGVVVILNVSAPTLNPDLVRYGLSQLLQKRRPDDSLRYPNTDGVIMISEAHTDVSEHGRAAPCFSSPTPHTKHDGRVRAFSDALIAAWAAFHNVPLVRRDAFRI